jgi:NitT/TauT family transport system ATP-binding protein
MIFQDYGIFPWMTAIQNVEFALKLRNAGRGAGERLKRGEISCQAAFYLDKVGIGSFAYKYPSQLSGGMRQRLALARALSVKPKIILMDEPFAAVDALTREKLQDELLRLWEETGRAGDPLTVVLVTHEVSEAVYLSDEVVVFLPSPGTVRNIIPVDVKRKRARTDPALLAIQERIFALFQYDLDQETDYSI